jgi:hypothetical protein
VTREETDIGMEPTERRKERRKETKKKRSSTSTDRCAEKVRVRMSGYRYRGIEYG